MSCSKVKKSKAEAKRLFWGCHWVGFKHGGNPKCAACEIAIEIQFFFVRLGCFYFFIA
jgi:hypothetical protein